MKKYKLILMLLLPLFISAESRGLNGILTFDEYSNYAKERKGISSFRLIDGKETTSYKVAIGSYPYRHKSGKVVFRQGCGLSIIDKEGFTTSVAPCFPRKIYLSHYYTSPQLSPDGLYLAVTENKKGYEINDKTKRSVVVLDIKGNKIVTHNDFFRPTWLPNGRLLLSSSGNRYGLFLTDKSLKRIVQIDNNRLHEYAYSPDVSPDGKRVVFEYNQQIWIMNIDGTGLKRLLRGSKRLSFPTWSPDGKYIAYLKEDYLRSFDEAIYFFEVDGEHEQSSLNTRKIFEVGKVGYPVICGPLSWISSDLLNKTEAQDKMKDIKKVGYSQKSFNGLMELLGFTLGRKLTKSEKITWVETDYTHARGNFKARQRNMKKHLTSFLAMNQEVQKVQNKHHATLIQKYLQEYLLMLNKKLPISQSNGMLPLLLKEHPLAIKIQEKEPKVIALTFNKKAIISNPIGIESLNIKKLKESHWIQSFYKQHQEKKFSNLKEAKKLWNLQENTQATAVIESWNLYNKSINYYAKGERPLGKNHKIIHIKPWGFTLYTDIQAKGSFDYRSPIYVLDTTDIKLAYSYFLNSSYLFNIGFDFNKNSPSDFQREMMSHINHLNFTVDGDKSLKISFKLWFDNEDYASAFMSLIQFNKIELKANYAHTSIDEWLLNNLNFRQKGKNIELTQTFSIKMTKIFVKRLIKEIGIF